MPMRLPSRVLTPGELDARLAEGDRRHGPFLYQPTCADCAACEAIRLPVGEVRSRRAHRRVLQRGDRVFRTELGAPEVDDARLALYEKHKTLRGLASEPGRVLDRRGYEAFLVERCVPAFELRCFDGERLAAVTVIDRGEEALSAVYCLWDPDYAALGLGTYAILKQLELGARLGVRWLYLGLYIADNPHMSYKARFLPHERRIDGAWVRFE